MKPQLTPQAQLLQFITTITIIFSITQVPILLDLLLQAVRLMEIRKILILELKPMTSKITLKIAITQNTNILPTIIMMN
ncbi:hypothetical protein A2476_00505 [candidate division CPR3 bacterium RIFOXYC2_FULL_35_7]|nr:MAG: hypothetical protein A2476_00505 [candidate division CPR3 bacterium RIFOXYC2_FULL_35_7]